MNKDSTNDLSSKELSSKSLESLVLLEYNENNEECEEYKLELIKNSIEFNAMKENNSLMESLLLTSCFHGHSKIVQFLVTNGVNINHTNTEGKNALMVASCSKNLEGSNAIVEILIKSGANLYHKDKFKKSAFLFSALHGKLYIIKLLLFYTGSGILINETDKDGKTALIFASSKGHYEIIEHLLKVGAEVNIIDNDKKNALIYACQYGYTIIANILLSHGANINNWDKSGKTALIMASANGCLEIVKLLCKSGAEINFQDSDGKTALIHASYRGHIHVVDILLFNNANIHHLDKNKKSALDFAKKKKYNKVCEILSYAGALNNDNLPDDSEKEESLLNKSNLPKPGDLKTTVCKNWKDGKCRFGDKCIFIHGVPLILGKEQRLCKYWEQGHCSFGSLCMFIHGESLLIPISDELINRNENTQYEAVSQRISPLIEDWNSIKCLSSSTFEIEDITIIRRFLISIANFHTQCDNLSIEWNQFCKLVNLVFKKNKTIISSRMMFDIQKMQQESLQKATKLFESNQIFLSSNVFIDFPALYQKIINNKNDCQKRFLYHLLANFYIVMFTSMTSKDLQKIVQKTISSKIELNDESISINNQDEIELSNFRKVLSIILYITPSLNKEISCCITRLLIIGNAYRGTPSIDKRNYIRSCYEIYESIIAEDQIKSEFANDNMQLEVTRGTFCDPFLLKYESDQILYILLESAEEKILMFQILDINVKALLDLTSRENIVIWGIGGLSVAQKETIVEKIKSYMKECKKVFTEFHKYLKSQNRKFNKSEIDVNLETFFKTKGCYLDNTIMTLSFSSKNICKCFPDLKFEEIIDNELYQSLLMQGQQDKWLNISDLYLSQYLFPGNEFELIRFWESITGVKINFISPDFEMIHVFYDEEEKFNNFQYFINNERKNSLRESFQIQEYIEKGVRLSKKVRREYIKISENLKKNIIMLYNDDCAKPLMLLARQCRVRLETHKNKPILPLVVSSLSSINLLNFKENLDDPSKFLEKLRSIRNQKVYAYIDASNVMIGAKIGSDGENHNIKLNPTKVMEVISGGRSIERTIVAGTAPDKHSPFWKQWGDRAIIRHYKKVTENGIKYEQGVDELLHLHILEDILSKDYGSSRRTMLLLTGDGNINSNNEFTNFPRIIDKVLEKSWNIELWSWKRNRNSIWLKYANTYSSHFKINYFDDYRYDLIYFNKNSNNDEILKDQKSNIEVSFEEVKKLSISEIKNNVISNENNKSLIYDDNKKSEETVEQIILNDTLQTNANISDIEDSNNGNKIISSITIENVILLLHNFLLKNKNKYMDASDFASFYISHPECKKLYQEKAKKKKFYSEPLAQNLLLWKNEETIGGKGRVYAIVDDKIAYNVYDTTLQNLINPSTDNIFSKETLLLDDVIIKLYSFILDRGGNMDASALALFYYAYPECRDLYKSNKKVIYNQALAQDLLLWKDESSAPGKGRIYALVNGEIIDNIQDNNLKMHLLDNILINNKEKFDDID